MPSNLLWQKTDHWLHCMGENYKGVMGKLLRAMDVFKILIVVIVSWMYTNVKTCILYTSNMCGLHCVYYISIQFLKNYQHIHTNWGYGVPKIAEQAHTDSEEDLG